MATRLTKLTEQWNAPEAPWGTKLKNWGGKALIVVSAIAELSNYFNLLPVETVIPKWLRAVVFAAGITNFLIGKMSKDSAIAKLQDHGQV